MSELPSLAEINQRIAELRAEHRSLDERIGRLAANPDDELDAKRLKKRRLQLKDCIARLNRSAATPATQAAWRAMTRFASSSDAPHCRR